MENRLLQAQIKDKEMEIAILKKLRELRGGTISGVRQEDIYRAIKYLNETEKYPITKLCAAVHVAHSSYYKWPKRTPIHSQQINEQVVEWIKQHYEETNGILGYRQMTISINREHGVHYNKKRIYRLMQILHLKSVTRIKKKNYIPSTPEITAENVLNRDFHADAPNEKWGSDPQNVQIPIFDKW